METGQEISLGKRTVQFIETRMLHWPDSMFSYLKEDALLISSDAFGHHWATSERFNDEVDKAELMQHCAKYFANILLPYSSLVSKLIEDVGNLGLKIDIIAPDHGVIWRDNPMQIVEAYANWAKQPAKQKALVVYDTMWHSTETMAKASCDGLAENGVSYKMIDLAATHRSDVVTELLDAKALILGSSTLNNNILPRMADLLCYIKGLKPINKIGAAFGSYGWSGEAVKHINEHLEKMKMVLAHPGVRAQYVPEHGSLHECVELGRQVARAIKEMS